MQTLPHELCTGTASPVTNVPAELCQAQQNGFVYLVRRFVPRDKIWDLQVAHRQTLTCLFLVLPGLFMAPCVHQDAAASNAFHQIIRWCWEASCWGWAIAMETTPESRALSVSTERPTSLGFPKAAAQHSLATALFKLWHSLSSASGTNNNADRILS